MAKRYPFYDTGIMGTSAQVITLFSQSEGSDANKQSQDTNMRIGGQWAGSETFSIDCISIYADGAWAEEDIVSLTTENYIKVIVEQETMLQIPVAMCSGYASFGGVVNQGTAGDYVAIGKDGHGFKLDEPIVVKGGVNFKVELHQVTALANAGQNTKVIIDGLLANTNSR